MTVPAQASIAVGVVVERRRAQSRWIDFTWRPVAVLAGQPKTTPWTVLSQDSDSANSYNKIPTTGITSSLHGG